MLHPQELDGMLNDKDFHALPFEQRQDVSERGISAASAYIGRNVGWTPERWQQFGTLAQQTREQVQGSETMLETAGRYAGVAGKTIKELPAMIGTGALGLSPVLPDGKPGAGVAWQVPGETLGPALGRNMVSLVASGAAMLSDKEQPLVKQLGFLKEQIDQGEFLNHKGGFNGWIDLYNKDIEERQGEFYGDKDYAQQNSLLGNEENVKLLRGYLVNRSPQAWAALQDNLLKTPFMAKLAADKVAMENYTQLGRALHPEARGLISEAADPAELIPGMLVAKQGVKAVAKGATKLQRAGDVALGVAGEMASEQVSATIDNPFLTLEQRLQVAKDSLAGALGLMGAAGAVQVGVNKLTVAKNANDGVSSNEADAAAAPTAGDGSATAGVPLAGGAAANAGETEQDVQQREGTLPPPTAAQLNRRPVEVGAVPMQGESELARIARQAGRMDAASPTPPGASTLRGVNAPGPEVPPTAVNPAPATATDPNAAPTLPPAATDLSAVADGVNLEADGTGRVLASRPVMPANRLSPLAAAAATLQSQRETTATPQPAAMSPEVPAVEAPSSGALGDIGSMSAQNIDWALTNLDGRGRQEALGVGMRHYSERGMSKEWYDYLAARVKTAEALSELNAMYQEMDPQAKVVTKALPQAELRQGDIGALTAEQAAWILTRTDGRNRQEALGVGEQHYSDPTMARTWAQFLAEKVRQDPEAMGELEGMYREMLPDAPSLDGVGPQAAQITNGANVLAAAHAAATAGGSTQWAPIKAVYEQALRLQPGLTPEAFMQAVQEGDNTGSVYLEMPENKSTLDAAGPFVLRNASGIPSTNMMMAPPRVRMSRAGTGLPPMQRLQKFWQDYANDKSRLRRGATATQKALPQIVSHYANPGEVQVRRLDKDGKIPGVAEAWRMDFKESTGKPLYAFVIHREDGHVHVNTEGMKGSTKARGGDLVYQSALSYAHNNELRFRPDPEGVSGIAHLRRLGHLLSSALRHGTTRHIEPRHARPEMSDVPEGAWHDGEEAYGGNVAALAEHEARGVFAAAAKRGVDLSQLRYEPVTDTIVDAAGRSLRNRDVTDLLERLDSATSGVGETAFLRALVSQGALQGHVAGGSAVLDDIHHDLGAGKSTAARSSIGLRGQPDGIFHVQRDRKLLASKTGSVNAARGRVSGRQAAEAMATLQQTSPAVAARVRIVRNRDALQQEQYHVDDWDSFAGENATEAFFDPSTGGTVVMLDNLVVRPGETPQRAVVRAILHERVGHAGLAAVRQGNPEAAARWQKLVEAAAEDAKISEELAALRERGYEQLNDEELVEEWFARQVEQRTPEQLQALTPQSGLLGKLWQWLKDATRYVARGFSRQNWTTRELQEMMRLSREALERGGPEGVRGDGRVKQSERMNPFHGSGVPNWLRNRLNLPRRAPFRVQALGLRALLKGSALPADLVPLVQQSQRDIAAVNETAAQLGRDLNGAIEAYAKRSGATLQDAHNLVARAMEDPALLAAMADSVLKERTRRTRNFLDDLSQVVATFAGGELGNAIMQNRGHWMRRSYAAFDPAANWNYDSLTKAASKGAQIAGVNARQILDEARAHITQSVNAERAAQGEPAAKQGEIEAIMRQLTDRNTWERNLLGNMAGSGISKNVTSLMQRAAYHPDVAKWMRNNRLTEFDYQTVAALAVTQSSYQGQNAAHLLGAARGWLASLHPKASQAEINDMLRMRDIPAPIRALMGEERNPLKRFLGSASFQSQYIARHEQQRAMRDLGLQMGLFSTQQTGVYTEEVGDSRERNGFKIDVQVPGPNAQPVTVQRTIYTTPELAAALRATQGSSSPADLGGRLLDALKFAGSEAKLNKVALNPDSWMVNAMGNVMGLVQSGDLLSLQGWQNVARAIQLHRSGQMKNGEMMNVAQEAEQDLRRQMLARLTAAGLANAGFEISDLNAALDNRVTQFINEHDHWNSITGGLRGAILGNGVGRSFGMGGRAVGIVLGAAGGATKGSAWIQEKQRKIAEWTTGNPDRIAKLAAFYGNYEAHLTAGMAEPDAFQLAVEKTMNTLPDYSKLPDFMRQLSRLGLAGSFIGFQHEVYRNTWHNARYAVQELRSGNPPLVARGARRLIGLSSVLALSAWGLSGIIRGLFSSGVDDDKDEAYRRALGADHERFGNLAYTKLDKDGASFFNTSYMLPQVTLFEVIKAGIEGKNLGESLSNLGRQLSDQFLEGSVHLDPLLSAWSNTTDFGKVSEEQGARNVAERLDYLLYNMMEPGALNKGDRMVRAMTGQSRYGRTFSLEEEALRLLGVRQNSYTHEKRISSRMFRFRDEYASARAAARKVHAQRPNSAEAMDALERSNQRIEALQGTWEQFQRDLKQIGVPTNEIERIRKATGTARTYPKLEMGEKGPESERARTGKIDAVPSSEEANKARGLVRVK